VARRPKEASREKTATAAGIERFFSLRGPQEENNVRISFWKCALCAQAIRLRVSITQNDETLSRNSLRYLSKADLPIADH